MKRDSVNKRKLLATCSDL